MFNIFMPNTLIESGDTKAWLLDCPFGFAYAPIIYAAIIVKESKNGDILPL